MFDIVYDPLQSIMINEIFLVGNRMLTFIGHIFCVIKQAHNMFMGGFNVVMIGNFYQALPIRDSWIFKQKNNAFNALGPNFWHENVRYYELKEVMLQDHMNFINILNQFSTMLQTSQDIDLINKICLKLPPTKNMLAKFFYTNTL